jgi:hypothetical protein
MPNITRQVQTIMRRETGAQPTYGTIFAIDGITIDVRVPASNIILRNVPVSGDVGTLAPGQTVSLRWEGTKPMAIATPQTVMSTVATPANSAPVTSTGTTLPKGGSGKYLVHDGATWIAAYPDAIETFMRRRLWIGI